MTLCNACNIRLGGEEELKEHYKSDFHAVNLKRRVHDLPPLSQTTYDRAIAAQEASKAAAEAEAAPCIFVCDACGKSFSSEGQFETHIRTKKHVARVKELLAERKAAAAAAKATADSAAAGGAGTTGGAADTAAAAGSSDAGVAESKDDADDAAAAAAMTSRRPAGTPAAGATSGFAGAAAATAAAAAADEAAAGKEMVVTSDHCLFCFHESEDVAANLAHMLSEHSFFVPDLESLTDAEGLVEHLMAKVVQGQCLYCKPGSCFDSPYAAQQHMAAKSHCKMAYETDEQVDEFSEYYTYVASDSDGEDDDDGEEGDDGEELDDDEKRMVLATGAGDASVTASGDLILPSGKFIGHRQWVRYYRQYFRQKSEKQKVAMERLQLDYKASGVVSGRSIAADDRSMALGIGTRGNNVDKGGQYKDHAYRQKFALRTGLGTNMIIRKYFRIQMRE